MAVRDDLVAEQREAGELGMRLADAALRALAVTGSSRSRMLLKDMSLRSDADSCSTLA